MMSLRILLATALLASTAPWLVGVSGCGTGRSQGPGANAAGLMGPTTDAPYELAYDQDLHELRDRYEAMAVDAPERAALRRELADEYARRIRAALLDPEQRFAGHEALLDLASLWTPHELAQGAAELAAYRDVALAVRDSFARSGGDVEAAAALFFLAATEPAQTASQQSYLAELEDIFTYADALAVARYGAGAEHARPIEILEGVVEALPTAQAVDRLIQRYVARQGQLAGRIRQRTMSPELIRAHGAGVFQTDWHIVRILARADRLDEAPATLAQVTALGNDDKLRTTLGKALGTDKTPGEPKSWLALAQAFDSADADKADAEARLHILLEGSRRHPDSAALLFAAGATARALERPEQAIALYERGLAVDPDHREATAALAELYRYRVAARAFAERPRAARTQLAALEAFLDKAQKRWPKQPLDSELAAAYAAMGRGLVSLGELEEAEAYLRKSLAVKPTHEALEYLGTIALKQDRFDDARVHFDKALRLPAKEVLEQIERAKILRLSGDALAGLGQRERAQLRWGQSIEAWLDLAKSVELPPHYQGELLVESAKAQWSLGDADTAISAFETAVDVDPDGADTHTSVVSFLITRGHYQRALDTYYRALGNHEIGDYAKVYMSLWMLAEARRRGESPDPLAQEYLAGRTGRLWYDELARYATGRAELTALEQRATTRGRRAELWYYTAVLGSARGTDERARKLLRDVLATGMVLFFEYDMAKYWLTEGAARLSRRTP